MIRTEKEQDRLDGICAQVRKWQSEGWHSIALIEKTEEQAKKLYRKIGRQLDARLISDSDSEYRGGVMILPAGIVKGMEFDCVGICDVSGENFPEEEFLCRILYVMMTRPLHRLSLWYRGRLSPLIGTCPAEA